MSIDKFKRALYDKLQTRLTANGVEPNSFKFAQKRLTDIIKDKNVLCPFCLSIFYLKDFSYSQGLYKCKHCSNKMRDKTLELMFKWFNCENPKIAEFAQWVYGYRLNGFFQKIIFKEWSGKLYTLGFSKEFWENYRRIKGEDKSRDDYEEDYL